MSIFSKDKRHGDAPPKKPSYKGALILGSPRSGTTMLRRLLDSHPEICCPGETMLFRACAAFFEHDSLPTGTDFGVLNGLESEGVSRKETITRLRGFACSFYNEMAARAGKTHWVAKTATDSFYMQEIEALFADDEDTRFIILLRHGLDVVCSMDEFARNMQVYIKELHDYIKRYPQPYTAFAHAWADVTTAILDFAEKYPERCHILRYEDLVSDTGKELEKITGFVGVKAYETSPDQSLSVQKAHGFGDFKAHQKNHIDQGSLNRWEKDLLPVTAQTLAEIVNPVLERAGYNAIKEESEADTKRRQELAQMLMQAKAGKND